MKWGYPCSSSISIGFFPKQSSTKTIKYTIIFGVYPHYGNPQMRVFHETNHPAMGQNPSRAAPLVQQTAITRAAAATEHLRSMAGGKIQALKWRFNKDPL